MTLLMPPTFFNAIITLLRFPELLFFFSLLFHSYNIKSDLQDIVYPQISPEYQIKSIQRFQRFIFTRDGTKGFYISTSRTDVGN